MSYEFTKLSGVPAVAEFPEGANAIIETNGEIKRCPSSNTPKPLTYDYMPEGYPTKTMETVTVMAEQEVRFTGDNGNPPYFGPPAEPFAIVVGQTYLVNWDGTDYECICIKFSNIPCLGNLSILGADNDTGEPFVYTGGRFITLDTSASHTISVTTAGEVVTPMAEEFLPNIPADKLPTIAGTTVYLINKK